MNIAIFGLGYVGSVSAACLAAAGHMVTGVDVEAQKLTLLREGRAPVTEPGLDESLAEAIAARRLRLVEDAETAVRESVISLVCVGTPSRRNGTLDTTYLERVLEQIGTALAGATSYHVIAIRSTVVPGLLDRRLLPLLERTSGRRVGVDLGVCINPEFLREGNAIRDFERPPFTIVGEGDSRAGDVLLAMYAHLDVPVYRVRPDEASMLKYACNAFHATKVAFANEIGAVCQQLGVDGRQVMQMFCADRDLNISARYLQPGFAFGGSCLPKDLRALTYMSRELDVATPLLGTVLASNESHIRRVVDAILATGMRRVVLLGLSFKTGSDDLRESPLVSLAEALIGRGIAVRVWDPDVRLAQLIGRNRTFVDERLPHLAQSMIDDWEDLVRRGDVVIVGKRLLGTERLRECLRPEQIVFDLVGIAGLETATRPWAAAPAPAVLLS